MLQTADIDWTPGIRDIADLGVWSDRFDGVEEPCMAPDGERVATIVRTGDGACGICVNGTLWEQTFDRAWHLRFSPAGRLAVIGSEAAEWTVCVDDRSWDHRFDFIWNLHAGGPGEKIVAATQAGGEYAVIIEDTPWPEQYPFLTDLSVSADGAHAAAVVQVVPFKEADIVTFQKGCYALAKDAAIVGPPLVNVWTPRFSDDGAHVAATVRTDLYRYAIMVDGAVWPETFSCAWAPSFHPLDGSVTAPVKTPGGWVIARDGKPIWSRGFAMILDHVHSPDGRRIAAIVATAYGRWRVAMDGRPGATWVSDMLGELRFSPDSRHLAGVAKHRGRYTVILDDRPWPGGWEMIWAPVFSPEGNHVATRAKANGRMVLLVDGRAEPTVWDHLWDPVFSPDGERLLVRGIHNRRVRRQVVRLSEILN